MPYPSDLTDEQWDLLEPVFNTPGKRGRRHADDVRGVVDAMLYIAQTGCQWRYLPESFGPWTRVWSQFRRWSPNGMADDPTRPGCLPLSGDFETQRREVGVDREAALAVERECRGVDRFGLQRQPQCTGIGGGSLDGFDQPTGDALATHGGVGEQVTYLPEPTQPKRCRDLVNCCESDHPRTVVRAVELELAGSGHLADPRPRRGRSRRLAVVDPVQLEQLASSATASHIGSTRRHTAVAGTITAYERGRCMNTSVEEGSARSARPPPSDALHAADEASSERYVQ